MFYNFPDVFTDKQRAWLKLTLMAMFPGLSAEVIVNQVSADFVVIHAKNYFLEDYKNLPDLLEEILKTELCIDFPNVHTNT